MRLSPARRGGLLQSLRRRDEPRLDGGDLVGSEIALDGVFELSSTGRAPGSMPPRFSSSCRDLTSLRSNGFER
jgi:hypothetical protein